LIDADIAKFVVMVDAKEPLEGGEHYAIFRRLFKRHNYFTRKKRFLIVKISRSSKPFWGVAKDFIDFFNELDYYLVLLTSPREGWVFSKSDVIANIREKSGAFVKPTITTR
jgi:hypothetical protein